MPMNQPQVRSLPLRDLVQALLTNTSDAQTLRNEANRRLSLAGEASLYSLCVKDSQAGEPPPWTETTEAADASEDRFPWRDEEIVLSWMELKQPWQIADEMIASGYQGEGMRDSEEAMDWVRTASHSKTEWRDLHPPAVRFWKAIRGKWSRWQVTNDRQSHRV